MIAAVAAGSDKSARLGFSCGQQLRCLHPRLHIGELDVLVGIDAFDAGAGPEHRSGISLRKKQRTGWPVRSLKALMLSFAVTT